MRPFHAHKKNTRATDLPLSKFQIPCLSPVQTDAQHCWPTTPNIVGCYMLRPFVHPVPCCCALLGVVAQSLKPVKLLATSKRTQQVGSCCVRLQVALHFFSLYIAQGIVCPSLARAHRVQHFPSTNQLRQHCGVLPQPTALVCHPWLPGDKARHLQWRC